MPTVIQLQILLTFVFATLALSAPAPIQKRSFKIARVPNPTFKGRSPDLGRRELIKAHRKFSIALPPGLLETVNTPIVIDTETVAAAASAPAIDVHDQAVSAAPAAGTRTPNNTAVGNGVHPPAKGDGFAAKAAPANSSASGHGGISASPENINALAAIVQSSGPEKESTSADPEKEIGIVTATPSHGDIEYLSPVIIGGQVMNMDFDTGSADLWVFNTQLKADAQRGHTLYKPQQSTTFRGMPGASWSIAYGDGSGAAGNVGTDIVDIGGAIVANQVVELATEVSDSFAADKGSNGLVGLAYSKLNNVKPTPQKTFFENVLPSLSQPVFTADLRKAAGGFYEFGFIDETKFNGSLSWAPINTTSGFWQFSSTSFAVGGGPAMSVSGGQAVADTGTSLLLANVAIVNTYYSQVRGAFHNQTAGGVTFPCDAQLPDLKLDVGGNYMAQIRGSDINFGVVDASADACFGGLQAVDGDLQIFGDIMFKSQFVVFNGGNNSIAMAPHQ